MSVEHLAVALHHSRAKGTVKLVLLGIANHDGDGGAWPTVDTLARYANVDRRNVQRAVDKLVQLGELVVYAQEGGLPNMADHDRPNRYEVRLRCPPWCDHTPQHRDTRKLSGEQRPLWIKGVAPAPRGGASAARGVAPAPPGGVAPAPPEPSLEPSINTAGSVASQLQTARAREADAAGPCGICGQGLHHAFHLHTDNVNHHPHEQVTRRG